MLKLKKHIQIHRFKSTIIVGDLGFDWLEFSYNNKNLKILNTLINGISKDEFVNNKSKILKKIEDKKWIYESKNSKEYLNTENNRQFWYNEFNSLGEEALLTLKNKKVLLFGCGGAGAILAYSLAQLKLGNLFLIDSDYISESDVLRCNIFRNSDVNKQKVNVLSKLCKKLGCNTKYENINISKKSEIENLIMKYKPDLVIKAIDPKLSITSYLNEVCFKNNTPYYSCAYFKNIVKLGPLFIPKITSCYEAINQYTIEKYGIEFDSKFHKRLFNNELFHPSINFIISICANLALKDVYFFLTNNLDKLHTLNRIITLDTITYQFTGYELNCNKKCKICKN